MNFLSLTFAGFGALVFGGWWGMPQRLRPWVLAAANLAFALWFGPKALCSLGLVWLLTLAFGRLLAHRPRRWVLLTGCCAVAAPLLLYKLLPAAAAWQPELAALGQLTAPVGISFYVFKAISCLVRLYRGQLSPPSPLVLFNYLGFFAQLSSGPIQDPRTLLPQLQAPAAGFQASLAWLGCVRFCWGMFLKKCLADILAGYLGALTHPQNFYGLSVLWSLVAYSLYLYFDFASYSQMSIGVANLLGIQVEENFLSPYLSRSIGEFWRRWHISLSSFLRDFIYIPMGGSRRGPVVLVAATLTTFVISGLWHGVTGGFLVWGALHGLYLLAGRATGGLRQKLWSLVGQSAPNAPVRSLCSWLCTCLLVAVGWFFFATATLDQAAQAAACLFAPASFSVQYVKESITLLGFTPDVLARLGLFAAAAFGVDWASRARGFGAWAAQRKPWQLVLLCYGCVFATLFYGSTSTLPNVYFAF